MMMTVEYDSWLEESFENVVVVVVVPHVVVVTIVQWLVSIVRIRLLVQCVCLAVVLVSIVTTTI